MFDLSKGCCYADNKKKLPMPKRTPASRTQSPFNKHMDLRSVMLAALGTLLIAVVAFAMGWRLYLDGNSRLRLDQLSEVRGEVLFTALKPEADDQGEVKLFVRRTGETAWHDTLAVVPLEDRAAWSWNQALPGIHYEFEAVLSLEGQEIDRTDTQQVTAPARNVEMALNVTWSDLPGDVSRPETTNLAGKVTVNGYIPENSVLEVYSAPKGEEYEVEAFTPEMLRQSTLLASVRNPQTSNDWSWDQAKPDETYEVIGVLRHNGQIIGTSLQLLTAEAGQRMLFLTLNSMAEAPETTDETSSTPIDDSLLALGSAEGRVLGATTGNSTISGVVYLQGPEQEGTSLLMLWKKPGDANYQVINRYPYPSQAGTVWQWSGAQAGQAYEIMAALQVNGNNSSTAPTPLTVTAPATNVNFTMNTWYVIPTTTGTPVFQTCLNRSGNSWQAQISIPPIQGAQQYWVQVGTTTNSGNVWNQQFSAGGNNQNFTVKVPAQENQQQFVQYSYATCDQCQGDDNFAPFSTSVGFTCI